jgi:flagellar FliJ protein
MATRFRFRLDNLLHFRSALEKDAERALARALQAEREAEAHQESLKERRRAVLEAKRAEAGRLLDLEQWRATERYLVALDRLDARAREALVEAHEATEACREALKKAHRDRLSLERLKDRRRAQHDLEQSRLETIQMDELAMLRFRRRSA